MSGPLSLPEHGLRSAQHANLCPGQWSSSNSDRMKLNSVQFQSWPGSHPGAMCQTPGTCCPCPLGCSQTPTSADRKKSSLDQAVRGIHLGSNPYLLQHQRKHLYSPSPAKHSSHVGWLGVLRWCIGSLLPQILPRGQIPSPPDQRFLPQLLQDISGLMFVCLKTRGFITARILFCFKGYIFRIHNS